MTELYKRVEVVLIDNVFGDFLKHSNKTYCLKPLHFSSLSGYTDACVFCKAKQASGILESEP